MIMVLLIAVAGGFGAVARFVLDGVISRRRRPGPTFPVGTMVINISGSLLLGLVAGATTHLLFPERWHQIIGTGFLGGYTTFSTAAVETVRLWRAGQRWSALLNGPGMLLVAVGVAFVGWGLTG
jgi:CrcB protein